MKRTLLNILRCAIFVTVTASTLSAASFPVIEPGDIQPNDKRLGKPIGTSKNSELTIVSFNVRNLGNMNRSMKDLWAIIDLVDEADIVVMQEVGLGAFSSENVPEENEKRIEAIAATFRVFLGDGWSVLLADSPSGVKSGRETSLIANRKQCKGFTTDTSWNGYIDLGELRDMPVFNLTLKKGDIAQDFLLASVHLTPDAPERGDQMIKASEWLIQNNAKNAIVMGDFNWGYKKTSGVSNSYAGEEFVTEKHDAGELFQLFAGISYLGDGTSEGRLRTTMSFNKTRFFYDQFLLVPHLGAKLADGGVLLEDCGVIAFGAHDKHMRKVWQKERDTRMKSLDAYLKKADLTAEEKKNIRNTVREKMAADSQKNATFVMSDHRPVWMQLKVW